MGKTNQRSTRGGARKGAGRKSKGKNRRKTLSVRIDPQTFTTISQIASNRGKSFGAVIDELVRQQTSSH